MSKLVNTLALVILALASCTYREYKVETKVSCYAILKSIDGAKETWAAESGATNGQRVAESDLVPLLREFPKCPKGGTYTLGAVGQRAKCSHLDHQYPPY